MILTALSLRTFTKRPLSAKYSHRHLSRHSLYDIQYNHYITINMIVNSNKMNFSLRHYTKNKNPHERAGFYSLRKYRKNI